MISSFSLSEVHSSELDEQNTVLISSPSCCGPNPKIGATAGLDDLWPFADVADCCLTAAVAAGK